MPRNVRNYWVEADVDGRQSSLAGGPRSKDGCIDVTLHMRHEGEITTPVKIRGRVASDGTLRLYVDIDGSDAVVTNIATDEARPDKVSVMVITKR